MTLRSYLVAILAIFALSLNWLILPRLVPQMYGPKVQVLGEQIPRDDQAPQNIILGYPHAPTYVTAWLSPDCYYCRLWWKTNLPRLLESHDRAGGIELIIRPLPESQRDLFVAQFLSCLPRELQVGAIDQFMSTTSWLNRPIADWPASSHENKACLSNAAGRQMVLDNARKDVIAYHIAGTPSFAIGDIVVRGNEAIHLSEKP